jgi:phosphoribosylanthranilate isomerase
MFVKICGVTNIKDAYACAEAGADAIGLNFYSKSKRFVPFDEAASIVREVSAYVSTVAIMVQPTLEDVARALDATEVDAVQVYEPEFDVRDFDFKKPLYYSVRVKNAADIEAASKLGADLIFLDAYVNNEFGGTGRLSNWEEIVKSRVDLSSRFVLSGGLIPENVCEAIGTVRPFGVDTASGVEESPRSKDRDKIRRFVSNAKQCAWKSIK